MAKCPILNFGHVIPKIKKMLKYVLGLENIDVEIREAVGRKGPR